MQRRLLRDHPEPLVLDAGQPGDRASTVGADHVLGVRGVALARAVVTDQRVDAVPVLVEADQLVVEADPAGGRLFRARLQQRLEADLREVRCRHGLAARHDSSWPPAPQDSRRARTRP